MKKLCKGFHRGFVGKEKVAQLVIKQLSYCPIHLPFYKVVYFEGLKFLDLCFQKMLNLAWYKKEQRVKTMLATGYVDK